jgi:hypothetical protein
MDPGPAARGHDGGRARAVRTGLGDGNRMTGLAPPWLLRPVAASD